VPYSPKNLECEFSRTGLKPLQSPLRQKPAFYFFQGYGSDDGSLGQEARVYLPTH